MEKENITIEKSKVKELKIGDIVRIKGHDVQLTCGGIKNGYIEVFWFNKNNDAQSATINPELID